MNILPLALLALLFICVRAQTGGPFTNPCTSPDTQLVNATVYVANSLTKRGTFGPSSSLATGHTRLFDGLISAQDFQYSCTPPCAWQVEFSFPQPVIVTSVHTIDDGAGQLNVTRKATDFDVSWITALTETNPSGCCGPAPDVFVIARRGPFGPQAPFTAKRIQVGLTSVTTAAYMDVIELFVCGRVATPPTTTTTTTTTTTPTTPAPPPPTTTTTTIPRPPSTTVTGGGPTTSTIATITTRTTSGAIQQTTTTRTPDAMTTSFDSITDTLSEDTSVDTPFVTPAPSMGGLSATETLIVIICATIGGCIVVGGIMTIIACCVLRPKTPSPSPSASAQYNAVPMTTYQSGAHTTTQELGSSMSLSFNTGTSGGEQQRAGYNRSLGYAGPSGSGGLDTGTADIYAKPDFDKPKAGYVPPNVMFAGSGETGGRGTMQRTYTVPDIDYNTDEKPKY
jgi:hypothetical protein